MMRIDGLKKKKPLKTVRPDLQSNLQNLNANFIQNIGQTENINI